MKGSSALLRRDGVSALIAKVTGKEPPKRKPAKKKPRIEVRKCAWCGKIYKVRATNFVEALIEHRKECGGPIPKSTKLPDYSKGYDPEIYKQIKEGEERWHRKKIAEGPRRERPETPKVFTIKRTVVKKKERVKELLKKWLRADKKLREKITDDFLERIIEEQDLLKKGVITAKKVPRDLCKEYGQRRNIFPASVTERRVNECQKTEKDPKYSGGAKIKCPKCRRIYGARSTFEVGISTIPPDPGLGIPQVGDDGCIWCDKKMRKQVALKKIYGYSETGVAVIDVIMCGKPKIPAAQGEMTAEEIWGLLKDQGPEKAAEIITQGRDEILVLWSRYHRGSYHLHDIKIRNRARVVALLRKLIPEQPPKMLVDRELITPEQLAKREMFEKYRMDEPVKEWREVEPEGVIKLQWTTCEGKSEAPQSFNKVLNRSKVIYKGQSILYVDIGDLLIVRGAFHREEPGVPKPYRLCSYTDDYFVGTLDEVFLGKTKVTRIKLTDIRHFRGGRVIEKEKENTISLSKVAHIAKRVPEKEREKKRLGPSIITRLRSEALLRLPDIERKKRNLLHLGFPRDFKERWIDVHGRRWVVDRFNGAMGEKDCAEIIDNPKKKTGLQYDLCESGIGSGVGYSRRKLDTRYRIEAMLTREESFAYKPDEGEETIRGVDEDLKEWVFEEENTEEGEEQYIDPEGLDQETEVSPGLITSIDQEA